MNTEYYPTVGPSEAAKRIAEAGYQVTDTSVRRWCKTYANYLSSGCNANPRQIGHRDILVLIEVGKLRAQNVPLNQIDQALAQMSFPDVVDVVEEEAELVAPEPLQVIDVTAIAPLIERMADRDAQLLQLSQRVQALESKQGMWVVGLMGFGLGLAVMAILMWWVG